MEYDITQEDIRRWKDELKEHPIDHAYDEEAELFDGKVPMIQLDSRQCYRLLKYAEGLGLLKIDPEEEKSWFVGTP